MYDGAGSKRTTKRVPLHHDRENDAEKDEVPPALACAFLRCDRYHSHGEALKRVLLTRAGTGCN